jgi:hypothetical protein
LTKHGWSVGIRSQSIGRTQAGLVVFATYVAEATRDGECLREEKHTMSEAVEFLFWKVAKVDEGIDDDLEKP